jgi:hypothetical protein
MIWELCLVAAAITSVREKWPLWDYTAHDDHYLEVKVLPLKVSEVRYSGLLQFLHARRTGMERFSTMGSTNVRFVRVLQCSSPVATAWRVLTLRMGYPFLQTFAYLTTL